MNKDNSVEPLRCPECNGLVYNRRYPLCEFCKIPLPKEFRLTENEKTESESLMKEYRKEKEEENWSFLYNRDTDSGGY